MGRVREGTASRGSFIVPRMGVGGGTGSGRQEEKENLASRSPSAAGVNKPGLP